MALGSSNITTAAVNTELGSPYTTPRLVSLLCKHANAGTRWSFYGTGTLGVDVNKTVVWTAPSSNYKLGDFRLYNRTAAAPAPPSNFTHNWGPGGATTSITLTSFPNGLNVLFVDSLATYMRYNAYLSTANRLAETGLYSSYTPLALFNTITPLTGHTRTQTQAPQGTQIQTWSTFPLGSITSPTDYVYLDTFYGNSSGNRLINLGSSVAAGYTTITMQENILPYIFASGSITPPPTGQTAAFPLVYTTSAVCSNTNISHSIGGNTLQFYVNARSVGGLGGRVYNMTAATVTVTYDGASKVVSTGAIGTTKKYINSTLPTGKTWQYNKNAAITISGVTWGTSWVSCP